MADKKISRKTDMTTAIDYLDMLGFLDGIFDEEPINSLLGEYAERGITAVQWCVSVFGKLLYRSKLGEMYAACIGRFGFDPPAVEAYPNKTGLDLEQ